MGVEREAKLLLSLIETVLDDSERTDVDKAEQIHDLITSPAAGWLAGKTGAEVFDESPYYVLFVSKRGKADCYTNEMGSPRLEDARAAATKALADGASSVYLTRIVELHPR